MRDDLSSSKIAEYFALTTYELEKGTSVDEIKLILKQYEDLEMYLECAGIYNALEVYKFNLSVDLAKIISEDKIKNNIKFIEDDRKNKKGS
jgi:hypothetical protein|tara:strand:+ start:1326 stop:1598 length:273 start_codon:yes stop_codon:yes gene_type:complete